MLDPLAELLRAVETLEPLAELLRAVERLRNQGKLDSLAGVRARATTLYPAWEAGSEGGVVVSDLQQLRLQAATEQLVMEADHAIQRDSRCFASYATAYRIQHEQRYECATAALACIEAHPAWVQMPPADKEALRKSFVVFTCSDQAPLILPASAEGRCPSCGSPFKDLRTDIELVEAREQQAVRKLDTFLTPPPPRPKPVQTITMDLRSPADLPQLYDRIAEVAKQALAVPRRVRVTFEDPDER